ncbi:hypothetical protein [Nonomuraea typhae]|uniref:hypothetical protein n=1 Tax=Nonomuraea typhae TaxID=2603600 RepID=UPI0012FB04D7|nr:hypothetical protein [Nonomuraea typhae]
MAKFLAWLSHKWWQGVAALLAVVAIGVAFYLEADKPDSPPQTTISVTGDCNAIGNSTANCPEKAPK